jgi:hypothetical protein
MRVALKINDARNRAQYHFTHSGYSGSIALDDTGTRAAFTDTQIFKGGKFIPFSQ